jgi:transcriptional regulator with XRE-family HTH domain
LYDPGLFRRPILPRLAPVKLIEIAEAAGCSKASASDIRRGKWTPHVSTLGALAELVEIKLVADAVRQTTLPRVDRL